MYFSCNMLKRIIFYLLFLYLIASPTNGTSEKPFRNWLIHLGMREDPRDVTFKFYNNTSTPRNEFTLLNSMLISSAGQEDNIHSRIIKNSGIPLVDLGGHYYYFVTHVKANYFVAMEICRNHGMTLLSIESEEENTRIINYIIKYLSKIEHFWTSGGDLGQEGRFVWLATGKPYNYTHWSPPNPDNAGGEHCMEIWKIGDKHYIWNDKACNNDYHFICELKDCTEFCR
ncbi:pulmonary surfactant-associated protein A-like [Harmonia axyridis]|uniref:pulmonary surfactant-associated protein A-like n=1 Tax=Harmonia axyridis TaxID=115357 RepID=UPI001E278460|nr:pulmonary surfactant-associated protein A-like [Harmonia axyridis]